MGLSRTWCGSVPPALRRIGASTAVVFAVLAAPASANPVPFGFVLVHVHDDTGDPCSAVPVSSCAEIVQTTDRTGTLAFDFLVEPYYADLPTLYSMSHNFQFTITWPADWQFASGSACGSGGVGVVQHDSQATFSIGDLHGAPLIDDGSESLVELGRLVLNVTSEGRVRRLSDNWWFGPAWSEGRAGIVCGNCVPDYCTIYEAYRPVFEPPLLELTAGADGMATGNFYVNSDGYNGASQYDFECSAPWISLDVVPTGQGEPEYDVTVHADGHGLGVGVHEASIEVRAPYCQECERVLFTVNDSIPSPARPESWGSLKSRFR
jgi:hypothetical protein